MKPTLPDDIERKVARADRRERARDTTQPASFALLGPRSDHAGGFGIRVRYGLLSDGTYGVERFDATGVRQTPEWIPPDEGDVGSGAGAAASQFQSVTDIGEATRIPGSFAVVHCIGAQPNHAIPVYFDEHRNRWVGVHEMRQRQLNSWEYKFTTGGQTQIAVGGSVPAVGGGSFPTDFDGYPTTNGFFPIDFGVLPPLIVRHFGAARAAGLTLEVTFSGIVGGDLLAQTRTLVPRCVHALKIDTAEDILTFAGLDQPGPFDTTAAVFRDWEIGVDAGVATTAYDHVAIYPEIDVSDPSSGNIHVESFQLEARYVSAA